MFGLPPVPWGPLGVMGGTDTRPTNSPEDMASLQSALAAVMAKNRTPNGRVARGFDQFGPQGSAAVAAQPPQAATAPQQLPPVTVAAPEDDGVSPSAGYGGALSAHNVAAAPAAAPAPWAGPHSVGGAALYSGPPASAAQAPDSWGPSGTFGAPQSVDLGPQQATGPDVIQKLMSYFKNKDNPSDG